MDVFRLLMTSNVKLVQRFTKKSFIIFENLKIAPLDKQFHYDSNDITFLVFSEICKTKVLIDSS